MSAPRRPALCAQERRHVNLRDLLEIIAQQLLPIALFTEPGERPGESGVLPTLHDPTCVVQHSQPAQRLENRELAVIEVGELRVATHERFPLGALFGGAAREEHPKILQRRSVDAIIEIDEDWPLCIPQQVSEVAVAVEPAEIERPCFVKRALDAGEQRAGSALEGWQKCSRK